MVWYQSGSTSGDTVISEVFEHIFHTVHLFGIMGAVPGSSTAVNWMAEENPNWQTTDLHLSMKQAIDNGMYDPSGYAPDWSGDAGQAQVAYKEYMYLLNFGMWEMSEFWEGGSLSPEWNDNMRTPSGIQTNNILGYNLFNSYFAPVLTKPSFVTLRNIFQDNHGGVSGYVADDCITPTPTVSPTVTPVPPTATPTATPQPTSTPSPQTFTFGYQHENGCTTSINELYINGVKQGVTVQHTQGSLGSGTTRTHSVYPGDTITITHRPFNLLSPCTNSYISPTTRLTLNGLNVGTTNSNTSNSLTYNYSVQQGVNPSFVVIMENTPAPTATPVPTYTLTLQSATTAEECAKGYIIIEKNGSEVARMTKYQGDTTASWDVINVTFTQSDTVYIKSYSQGGGGAGCANYDDTRVRSIVDGSFKTTSEVLTGTNGQSYLFPDSNQTVTGQFIATGGL
jgi:hypothetical protein